jgi:hypothetical protein
VNELKLGREIAVDLQPEADFNQNWRCPCHDSSVWRLALPRTATLSIGDIAKEMRYKRTANTAAADAIAGEQRLRFS